MLGGVLAVAVCAWMSAVLLTADADRDGELDLVAYFRRRSLVTGVAVGAIALVGIVVIETDAE
jgi:cytochrome d ubiquinol oxidase subunit II